MFRLIDKRLIPIATNDDLQIYDRLKNELNLYMIEMIPEDHCKHLNECRESIQQTNHRSYNVWIARVAQHKQNYS